MTCAVCSEYYTDPLMLPCLHSFCKKCIIKPKEKEGSPDTSLKCPTCDTIIPLPDSKFEDLTQNLWLAQQVREASIKNKMSKKAHHVSNAAMIPLSCFAVSVGCFCANSVRQHTNV